jgi:ADP-ribose pyrophosphatase YjhB (NUDIX family)
MLVVAYDETYPIVPFRGLCTLLGGNARGDRSPRATLEREVREECGIDVRGSDSITETVGSTFVDDDPTARDYAPAILRKQAAEAILTTAKPFGDFHAIVNKAILHTPEHISTFVSAFTAELEQGIFSAIVQELEKGKQLTNEGLALIVRTNDLMGGTIPVAWGHATVVGDILGLHLPEFPGVAVKRLGEVRDSYASYKKEFMYRKNPEQ